MPKTKDTAQTAEVVEKPKTTRKKAPAKEPKVSAPAKAVEAKEETSSAPEAADAGAAKPKSTKKRSASAPRKTKTVKESAAAETPVPEKSSAEAPAAEPTVPKAETPVEEPRSVPGPRRSIAFIGSECYPFVKTGGLGDVMYALPKALSRMNCDVKVILPRYRCIPWEYQRRMVYRGEFQMPLCSDGRTFYVGIMEYVWDGVVYDFIDNQEFFSDGNPYTSIIADIPKYCFFSKAALAALNFMNWIPDVIH